MIKQIDRWYLDRHGMVRAGIVWQNDKRLIVGEKAFLPPPDGAGLGRLERKVKNKERETVSLDELRDEDWGTPQAEPEQEKAWKLQ